MRASCRNLALLEASAYAWTNIRVTIGLQEYFVIRKL